MGFLKLLEGIRVPFLDTFFSLITRLGEETVFIVLGLIFFWCINKKEGYYLLSVGFIGTILNQFLKLLFRIPRPWVQDRSFTIVESAREAATGYSFPSGHTQSAIGVFGGIARWNKNKTLRIICIALCVLVPFSRMYLGVHTPLDVGVSLVLGLILVFGLYPLIRKSIENPQILRVLLIGTIWLAALNLLFVKVYPFPAGTNLSNLSHGMENAYKMLGCTIGIYLSFEIDSRFIKFNTEASFLGQLLKFVVGLIPVVLIKSLLKTPLIALFGNSFVAGGVRYFILVMFAACVWPLTFKYFAKWFPKKENAISPFKRVKITLFKLFSKKEDKYVGRH